MPLDIGPNRVETIETAERLSVIETRLESLATRENMANLRAEFYEKMGSDLKWIITLLGLMATILIAALKLLPSLEILG